MASGLPWVLGAGGTGRVLLICVLLLHLWPGTAGPAESSMLLSAPASHLPAPPAALRLDLAAGPAHRAARSTPLWRMVGSKPLGAFCRHGLECSSSMCRDRQCAIPRYVC